MTNVSKKHKPASVEQAEEKPTFESAIAEQLYNAGQQLKQIAAQVSHIEKRVTEKEQEIEALYHPVVSAEQVVTDAAQDVEQIALRLKYNQNKLLIVGAEDTTARHAVTEVEQEQARMLQAQKDAQVALSQARATHDEQMKRAQSELDILQSELHTLGEQQSDFHALQLELHTNLGRERMEALRSQIDTAKEIKQRYQQEIENAQETIDFAQSAIYQDLARWPELRDELLSTHGKQEKQDDATTMIFESWLHLIDTLQKQGRNITRPLPEDVTRAHITELLPLNGATMSDLMYRNVISFHQREIVEMVLRTYRFKYHLPGEAR